MHGRIARVPSELVNNQHMATAFFPPLPRHLVLRLAVVLCLGAVITSARSAESRPSLVSNGLEFGTLTATSEVGPSNSKRISFKFTLRNMGKASLTVLTKNFQTELWNYKDPPRELHITLSALPMHNGQVVHPQLTHFSPVTLKPGESVAIQQDYIDRRGIKDVALVYDMLNSTSEKYGTWRGRIRSSVVSVSGQGN